MSIQNIPSIGFGTFNNFKDSDKVHDAVKHAIRTGYRLIDCARLYGNEKEVGAAIRECIEEGIVKREDLFIISKLWCNDHAPEDVEPACRKSLEDLGLTYLDSYMMHWPVQWEKEYSYLSNDNGGTYDFKIIHSGDRQALAKTYGAMEKLVGLGLAKSLGVSNFSTRLLSNLLQDCTIPPLFNEVEMHPLLQQQRLFWYCKDRGINVIGYSPLGKIGYKNSDDPNLMENKTVNRIAKEAKRTPAQILLRWSVQRGGIVIPKSLTPHRIDSNFDILGWALTPEQMRDLNDLDEGFRFVNVDFYSFPDDNEDLSLIQPKAIDGLVDSSGEVYRNSFYRPGKVLKSDVIIECGALRKLKTRAKEYIPEKCHDSNAFLIVDTIVNTLLGDQVVNGINEAGIKCFKIVVPADAMDASGQPSGERFKSLDVFASCVDQILQQGISKNSCIISLGGGVVNNICGFIASSLYRGISLVHFTTTMMGMTDAAIDFKQAVNHKLGKNLIGSYYPASTIVIDTEALKTLSKRHILNGIAEALKHALAQSRGMTEAIVQPLAENLDLALEDPQYLDMVCRKCIDHKVPTLIHYNDSDFNEMVPQYGHAIAHAIEHLSFHSGPSVKPLLHGEAVAIGMCVTAEVSKMMGICDQKTVDEHYDYIYKAGLPVYVPRGLDLDAIQRKLCYDKHYVKKPTMGLPVEVGHMFCKDGSYALAIENDMIRRALEANFARRDQVDASIECRDLYTNAANSTTLSPQELAKQEIISVVMESKASVLHTDAMDVYLDGNMIEEWRSITAARDEVSRKENLYWRIWARNVNARRQ